MIPNAEMQRDLTDAYNLILNVIDALQDGSKANEITARKAAALDTLIDQLKEQMLG